MNKKIKPTLGVKIVIAVFTFWAILILFTAGVFALNKFLAIQDANNSENLTEEHIKRTFPEAKIVKLQADTSIFGERQAHVIFEDEPKTTYTYLETPPGVQQIKPNPPQEERSNYKYVE